MAAALTDPAVAALSLAPVELIEVAVLYVQPREEPAEVSPPGRELDDVIHDQVVPSASQSGQAAVEPREKPWSHLMPPVEWPARLPALRQQTSCDEMIRGNMQERLIEHLLQHLGER